MSEIILGIESSCDDTAAAICIDGKIHANVVSSQLSHAAFGGVVPELASRMHQVHIATVVQQALKEAAVRKEALRAVAFTSGPGLLGSLLVGSSFAKGFALGLGLPLIPVDHLTGHIASLFTSSVSEAFFVPALPLICLTVSGGHTQLQLVSSPVTYEVIGRTLDDAAGEAFDKAAKMLGLPYPGGPLIDKLAAEGNPDLHTFKAPRVAGLDFSFSGLKTAFLYYLRDAAKGNTDFVSQQQTHLAAGIQQAIVSVLLEKLFLAAQQHGVKTVAIVGGVSANSALRRQFVEGCVVRGLQGHIPPLAYCTDNAAMIATVGHYLLQSKNRGDHYSQVYATKAKL